MRAQMTYLSQQCHWRDFVSWHGLLNLMIKVQEKKGGILTSLHASRDFFETINEKNASVRSSSPYLAIDEILYPCCGSIGIKQYNPSKLAKYWLLYHSLRDAVVPFSYYTLPYAGKPSKTNNEASKYISGTDEYTKYLVNGGNHYSSIDGSNISMDRYFTSVTMAQWY